MKTKPSTEKQEFPLWIEICLASKWPLATVASVAVLSATSLYLLSRPIPIRIVGGLQVDQIYLPKVKIDSNQPLAVKGSVEVQANQALPILGQVMVEEIKGTVSVDEIRMPVDVVNSSPLKVEGKVGIDGKVDLEGNVGASIKPKLF